MPSLDPTVNPISKYDGPALDSLPPEFRPRVEACLQILLKDRFSGNLYVREGSWINDADGYVEYHIFMGTNGRNLQQGFIRTSDNRTFEVRMGGGEVSIIIAAQNALGVNNQEFNDVSPKGQPGIKILAKKAAEVL
jgi:hypothetical protein